MARWPGAGQTVRYYGPDWLGTSWDHVGRAPQHRILERLCYVTHCDCIPIWVNWLVWTSYGPDREASLITQHHRRSTTAVRVGYGPRSESGHQGRTEQTARIGAVTADIVKRFNSATL